MNSQLEFHLRAHDSSDGAQVGGNKNDNGCDNVEATMRNANLVMPHSADRPGGVENEYEDDEAHTQKFGLTFFWLCNRNSNAAPWITLVGVGLAAESYYQLTSLPVRLEVSSLTIGGNRHVQIPVSIALLLFIFLLSYFSLTLIHDFLSVQLDWSYSDVSNSSLETIARHNKNQRQQQVAAVRLKIYKVVRSIQPIFLHQLLLDLRQNDNTKGESSCLHIQLNRYHESSLLLWVGFAHAHSTLIQTLDRAVGIIKLGTTLQLGATEHAAERIERALFGTSEHRHSHVENDGFAELRTSAGVSFATLRGLVMQVMDSQAKLLFDAALLLKHCPDRVTSKGKMRIRYVSSLAIFGRLPKVVTLTRLRSSQQEISELLSHVLHKGVIAMGAGGQQSVGGKLLQNSIARAYELQQYLQSSLGTSTIDKVSASDETISISTDIRQSSSALGQRLIQTKSQLQNFYVALLALQTEASRLSLSYNHNRDDDEDQTRLTNDTTATAIPTASSLKECWDGVKQCSHTLYHSMQNMDQVFSQKWHGSNSLNETAESFAQNGKTPKRAWTDVSHTVENEPHGGNEFTRDVLKSNKTSVFSGHGSLDPPTTTASSHGTAATEDNAQKASTTALPQPDPLAQHFLVSELQRLLQTLSLPEEKHETADTKDCGGGHGGNNQHSAAVGKTTAVRGATDSMFVELNSALKLLGLKQGESDGGDAI